MTQAVSQIPFDLAYPPSFQRADFLVAPCNQDALAWIDTWPDWPGPALILHGPAASGKSHLAAIWSARSQATRLSPLYLETCPTQIISPLVIDRVDLAIGDIDMETCLFHIYNMAKEGGFTLLLTSAAPMQTLAFTLPDLASRLRAAASVGISPPDDALLQAVLTKLFSDRQLQVSADVITFAVTRMERSFGAAHALVSAADALALSQRKPITLGIIRQVLAVADNPLV
ncbi:MAG: DnaA/Hda family protein [Pseudomonadota bacterium]